MTSAVDNRQSTELMRLQHFLRTLFRLDDSELEFGLHRLFNAKKNELQHFVIKEIPEEIKLHLMQLQEKDKLGAILECLTKVSNDSLNQCLDFKSLERVIMDHLVKFFSRYYHEGDFIVQQRLGGREKYVIPHDGKEVTLHWVNKDQYYTKSTVSFQKYQFRIGDIKIKFRITWVQPTKSGTKSEKRMFVLLATSTTADDNEKFLPIRLTSNNVLEVDFHHRKLTPGEMARYGARPKQDVINEYVAEMLVKEIRKIQPVLDECELKSTLLKHLRQFTRKNTRDYFIHKNLKDFLLRELDFYIKNEMINLDGKIPEMIIQQHVAKVFKEIASQLIDLLAQFEDFQKILWEKKKFVLTTHHVITLDRISNLLGDDFLEKELLPQVLSNAKQLQEWQQLLDLSIKIVDDVKIQVPGRSNQSKWKPLPLDTKHFDDEFKWRLLSRLTRGGCSLDDELDGLVIHGENWQALNLMQEKFRHQIRTIYIDPPYNTRGGGFLYKDRFRHSSWLTMMADRLRLARDLMARNSALFVSIDDNELYRLKLLLDSIFGESNYVETFLWTRTSTPPSLSKKSRTTTEYILCYERPLNPNLEYKGEHTTKEGDQPLLNRGNPVRELVFPPNTIRVYLPDGRYPPKKYKRAELLDEIIVKNGIIITECRLKGEFKWSQEFLEKEIAKGTRFVIKSEKFAIRFIRPPESDGFIPPNKKIKDKYVTELNKKSTGVDTNDVATRELRELGLDFTNPKPVSLVKYLCRFIMEDGDYVLDFFAGSGTTGHAILSLNAEDRARRKFILVEMADYVNEILLPRLKKVAFCKTWKDGKPILDGPDAFGNGMFIKYHCIESYEDSLENVTFADSKPVLHRVEDYFLSYMLSNEAKDSPIFLNVGQLSDPFNYKIKIVNQDMNATSGDETLVDLVETFNYLLGIWVEKVVYEFWNDRPYLVVLGRMSDQFVAVVWRTIENSREFFIADKEFIEREVITAFEPDLVYVNGDCIVKGVRSLDGIFKRLLFRVDG